MKMERLVVTRAEMAVGAILNSCDDREEDENFSDEK